MKARIALLAMTFAFAYLQVKFPMPEMGADTLTESDLAFFRWFWPCCATLGVAHLIRRIRKNQMDLSAMFEEADHQLRSSRRRFGRGSRQKQNPPTNAGFLIHLFLPWATAESMLGDLQERYFKLVGIYGHRRAWFWYWFQTFMSIRPILWVAAKRASGLLALAEFIRRRVT